MRWYYVFLTAFVLSLAIQIWIVSVDSFTDQGLWEERLGYLERDFHDGTFVQQGYSAHPGTVILLMGDGIHALGFSNGVSLKVAVTILVSLGIGGLALLLKELSPTSWWWLAGTAMATLNPLFTEASPTNAVVAVWTVLLWYFAIFLYQYPEQKHWVWIGFGMSLGIALSAHFGLAALCSLPIIFLAGWQQNWQKMGLVLLLVVVVFIGLDPLLWYLPKEHGLLILQRIEVHVFELGVTRLTPLDLPLFAPVALASWVVGLGILWRTWTTSFSRTPLLVAVISTVAISAVFLYAKTQSVRYFFPLIMLWEVALPLWLFELTKRVRLSHVVVTAAVLALLAAQAVLLIEALY